MGCLICQGEGAGRQGVAEGQRRERCVTPAEVGVQCFGKHHKFWIPAFAGMTLMENLPISC
jgi:hypothetical protein